MSTYYQTAENTNLPGDNVLSATGLPRGILREYFLRNGLFGADSDLQTDEQSVVAQAVGRTVPTLKAPAPGRKYRLEALKHFAQLAVRQGGAVEHAEWDRAQAFGIDERILSEVERVVGIVRDVYGLPRAIANDAVLATVKAAPAPLPRAA